MTIETTHTDIVEARRLPERGKKAYSVEFWRFAFTVLVAVYHLEIYFSRREIFLSGVSAVEFFFLLAGFLMAKSAERDLSRLTARVSPREAHTIALDFVKKKLRAIYPILIFVMLIWIIMVLRGSQYQFVYQGMGKAEIIMNSEWELLLMVGTPFGFNNGLTSNIPMWFITALLLVGYIYTYAIYRHYDFVNFFAPAAGVLLCIFFSLTAPSTLEHGALMGFFNAGTVKAAALMSLGIALYRLYAYLSNQKIGIAWRVLLSVLEIYAVYRLFALIIKQPLGVDNYRRVVYIMIILLLSFLNVTALSKVLSNRFSKKLGAISLAIYLCHYCLIPVYFDVMSALKLRLAFAAMRSPLARTLHNSIKDIGGSGYNVSAMSYKDMLTYMLIVICVSILILLLLAAIKRFVIRPLRKARTESSCVQVGQTEE